MTAPIAFDDLARLIAAPGERARKIVAVAGAPGSGKSTLAERLVKRLNAGAPESAALLPMDGYHYDDRVLIARGLRARKGAPETFDALGLMHLLARLKRNDEDEVAAPVFDRSLEISRAGARIIARDVRTLIVEGNYLLLRLPPWSRLAAFYDLSVMVETPEAVLRERLIRRWRHFKLSPAEIEAKVEGNDLPNGRFVVENSAPADYAIRSG